MTKLLKPNARRVTHSIAADTLGLVGAKIRAGYSLSQTELDSAYDWAIRTHLRASDNPRVKIPPMPFFLEMSVPDFARDFPLLKKEK